MGIRCFLIERTQFIERKLRRYAPGGAGVLLCPNGPYRSFHNAERLLDVIPDHGESERADKVTNSSLDWPVKCDYCDYQFTDADEFQVYTSHLYEGIDPQGVKVTTTLREAPVGAMWDAHWMSASWKGNDGKSIVVMIPGRHDWCIDAIASNCKKRDDRDHRCWIRHGTPPNLTVDKRAGVDGASAATTCDAGAGSIQTSEWHGYLRDGELVQC